VRDAAIQALARHLCDSAPQYFDLNRCHPVKTELVGKHRRHGSTVYRFRVTAEGACHRVVVKVPGNSTPRTRPSDERAHTPDRPRLFPKADIGVRAWLEHVTLTRMREYFEALHDPRFGVVRILDFVPEHNAVVMNEVDEPQVAVLLKSAGRLRRPLSLAKLGDVFRHTGAWLRIYHGLPPLGHTRRRQHTRVEFVELTQAFTMFIAPEHASETFVQTVSTQVETVALATLPAELPLGMGHSDFAPHNCFAGAHGRVTVFDTVGRWQAPIYEDLGHFLVALKSIVPHVQGRSLVFDNTTIRSLENAFVGGYFGSAPVPIMAIRLFEIQALLDRWCSMKYSLERATGWRKPIKHSLTIGRATFFRRYLEELVLDLPELARSSTV